MNDKEAMKLALEALNNSVDLVVEDAYNAEKLYGNYPSRQAKVGGLKVLAENHKQAIKALEEALAKSHSDVKQEQRSDRAIADSEHTGEPVAWYIRDKDSATTDGCWAEKNLDICEPLYTTPPQRKPLTGEQKLTIAHRAANLDWVGKYLNAIEFVVEQCEAAHGIKE